MQKELFTEYIDQAKRGRNEWWRYLLGFIIILTCWTGAYILGDLITGSWADFHSATHSGILDGVHWYICRYLYKGHLGMLGMLASILLVVRLLHQRSMRSVFTIKDRADWKLLFLGFGFSFFFVITMRVVDHFCAATRSGFGVDLAQLAGRASTAMVGTIIGATAEEVLNRGYILQGLGLLTRNWLVLASTSGMLFMMGHVPMVGFGNYLFLLSSFEIGFFLAIATLKSNGLEFAIGMHIGHNLAGNLFLWSTRCSLVCWAIFFPICAMIIYFAAFRRTATTRAETATSQG